MVSDWKECTLGEVITLQRGFDLPIQDRKPGIVPIVSSSGITGTHSDAKVLGPGVVTGRYGTIGQVFYVTRDFWPLNTTLYIKDFKGNDPLFISFLLKTIDFEACSDKSSVPGVNRNHLHMIRVCLPSLSEQHAIAYILGTLDDKIELNRQMNEMLESIAQTLFKSWFVDFDPVRAKMEGRQPYGMDAETAALFPDEFEDSQLGMIPKGWRVGTFKECCIRVENGGTPSRNEPVYWERGTIPWLTSGEVRQGIVTSTKNLISREGLVHSSAKIWPKGTTVVALYGATAGQVCLLTEEMCANQACCGLVPASNARFYLYLRASSSIKALEQQARGSAQ